MSEAPDYLPRLNLADIVARIERQQAETRKFTEENAKFMAEREKLYSEAAKFTAEREKLYAEAAKLNRDRSLSPWLAGGAVAGGVLTLATLLLKAFGIIT